MAVYGLQHKNLLYAPLLVLVFLQSSCKSKPQGVPQGVQGYPTADELDSKKNNLRIPQEPVRADVPFAPLASNKKPPTQPAIQSPSAKGTSQINPSSSTAASPASGNTTSRKTIGAQSAGNKQSGSGQSGSGQGGSGQSGSGQSGSGQGANSGGSTTQLQLAQSSTQGQGSTQAQGSTQGSSGGQVQPNGDPPGSPLGNGSNTTPGATTNPSNASNNQGKTGGGQGNSTSATALREARAGTMPPSDSTGQKSTSESTGATDVVSVQPMRGAGQDDALGGTGSGIRETGKGSAAGSGDLQGALPSPERKPATLPLSKKELDPTASPDSTENPTGAVTVQPAPEEIEVPDLDLSSVNTPTTNSLLDRTGTPIELATGAWEQIGVSTNNGPDFGPGGYSKSCLIINGNRNECSLYRTFGNTTLSGQFSMNLSADGSCAIAPSSINPTEFPSQARTIPLGGGGTCTITPPTSKSLRCEWSSRASDSTLIINSKEYRRIDDSVAQALVRGEPVLSGTALDQKIEQSAKDSTASRPGGVTTNTTAESRPTQVDFFGTQVRGRYVAFVIDNSGSMGNAGKLDATKAQMIRTIEALPKGTNIFVVFFSGTAFTIPGFDRWIPAKSSASANLVRSILGVPVLGGTDPTEALKIAFGQSPVPDQVFFMTDGQMQTDARSLISTLNGKSKAKTRVDTFAIGDDAEQALLSAIAAENWGQFNQIK